MSATAEELPTELAVLPPKEKALDVYTASNGLDPYLAWVREEIDAFSADVSTNKGRKEIASMAFKVAKCKTALDGLGKDLVTELKEKPKKVDAERKRMRDLLDQWKDEVRQPLTEWEQAEAARVEAIKGRLNDFDAPTTDLDGKTYPSAQLRAVLEFIESIAIDESWEEFTSEAARAKDSAITRFRGAIAAAEKYEAEQAELEKLRAEAAAREQADREARIAQEAKERAEAEARAKHEAAERQAKEAAERREREYREAQQAAQAEAQRREQEHAAAIARAEQEKKAAEQRAIDAANRERARIEAQQAAEKAEAARKAANKEHRRKINIEVLEDLLAAGFTEDQSKAFIEVVVRGNIRHTSINY